MTPPSALRRGLPRAAGAEPWPPAGAPASVAAEADSVVSAPTVDEAPVTESAVVASADVAAAANAVSADAAASTPATTATTAMRRGLPRVAGGEPWPAGTAAPSAGGSAPQSAAEPLAPAPVSAEPVASASPASVADPAVAAAAPTAAPSEASAAEAAPGAVRRGLPRSADGEPWPPADTAPRAATPAVVAACASAATAPAAGSAAVAPAASVAEVPVPASAAVVAPAAATDGKRAPLTVPQTVWAGRAARHRPAPKPEPQRLGPFTRAQWAGAVIVGGGGLLFAAALAVVFVRAFLSLDFMQDFLTAYPGEYHLPEGAPVGIPAWLGWQHFFNVFLMVLIIRSGLTIRTEKRPSVFWTPRGNPKGKTSLTIWFHQALDVLWLANGLVFIVLLFVTGQWMRIIPTSWEVIPNAVSAALQYVSLDWPTENGWVNYNALQQIAYFSTVFVAAPLAAVTGYRMSGMWPKGNAKLNAAYPIEWARKVHFPVMLYFVVFIFIHVALVLATGALRNLNHMYAAQGSVDGVAYADNWTGFWMFALSLVVIAAAWVAARPLVLAPIARLFGTVSGR